MLKMSKGELCRRLLKQRDKGIRLSSYLGARYFVWKGILIGFTVVLFMQDEPFFRAMALVGAGYLVGMIAAHLQRFVQIRNAWPVQENLFDWKKVKKAASTSENAAG